MPRADLRLKRFTSIDYIEGGTKPFARIDVQNHWLGAAQDISAPGENAVEVKNLELGFTLKRAILKRNRKILKAVDNISFEIRRGETFGLVGESGSGKSTVARCIARLYKPDAGHIRILGRDLLANPRAPETRAARRSLQMIFQDPYSSLNGRMRVLDIVAEPMRTFSPHFRRSRNPPDRQRSS